MRKFDLDGSGALEYPEFRKMWLYCCNPFTELKNRGVSFSRFARAPGLRVILEEIVIREEQKELRAMAEAHAHHNFLLERKRRLRAIQRAFERAQDELSECLDLAGQVRFVYNNDLFLGFCFLLLLMDFPRFAADPPLTVQASPIILKDPRAFGNSFGILLF